AEHLRDAEPRKLASCEIVQIGLPATACVFAERGRVGSRSRDELLAHFRTDAHRAQRALDDSTSEATPTSVSRRDPSPLAIAQQDWQAISREHDARVTRQAR